MGAAVSEGKVPSRGKRRIRHAVGLVAVMVLILATGPFAQPAATAEGGPKTLFVDDAGSDSRGCIDPTAPCRTINWAIGEASAGDTVRVATGQYREALTVNKSLTIQGPYAEVSPNKPGDALTPNPNRGAGAVITPPAGAAVTVDASNVTLTGLDVDMGGAGQEFVYSARDDLTLTVARNIFRNATSLGDGNWLLLGAGKSTLRLTDNRFTGSQASKGISVWNDMVDLQVEGNVWLDNQGWAMNLAPGRQGSGRISDNWVGNSNRNAGASPRQSGFLVNGEWPGLTVSGNTFQNVEAHAINFWGDNDGRFRGAAKVANNLFTGFSNAGAGAAVIGVQPSVNPADVSGVTLRNNAFVDWTAGSVAVDNQSGVGTITATSNWWGTPNGPTVNKAPGNGEGARVNSADGNVRVDPWIRGYTADSLLSRPGFWPLVGAVEQTIPPCPSSGICAPLLQFEGFFTGNTVNVLFSSGVASPGGLIVTAYDASAGSALPTDYPVPVGGFQLGNPPVYFTFETTGGFQPFPGFELFLSLPESYAGKTPQLYRNSSISGGGQPWEKLAADLLGGGQSGEPVQLRATLQDFSTYAVGVVPDPSPEPTPTPTPQPLTKKAQKPVKRAKLPARVKRAGLTVIAPANARTNAGQRIATTVRCRPGKPAASGQVRFCSVIRGPKGKVRVRTYGQPVQVVVTQRAPATTTYKAMRVRSVYVNGRKR